MIVGLPGSSGSLLLSSIKRKEPENVKIKNAKYDFNQMHITFTAFQSKKSLSGTIRLGTIAKLVHPSQL
jgi:hypothetical protein